ncbi:MAG: hypothetical protein AAFX40_15875 [Cyanobacteria bacterium J06639_1]
MREPDILARSPSHPAPANSTSADARSGDVAVAQRSILLVGAGKRIESTVLPALACLPAAFQVAGIYSRSPDKLNRLQALWQIPVSTDLDSFDWEAIDLIYVAVTLHNVPDVLAALTSRPTSHATLVLDTPVLAKGHLDFQRYFRAFQATYVAEDCIALPPVLVARQLIASGAIGRPLKLWMFHSGYRYHAIATARSLVDRTCVLAGRSRRYGRDAGETHLRFASGFEVTIVKPRDYSVGRFLLIGSEGAIADYPLQADGAQVIQYAMSDERWTGLTVNGTAWPKSEGDRQFDALLPDQLSDPSLMTQLKIRGLMTVLEAIRTGTPTYAYPAAEGIYDSMLSYALDILPTWFDGLVPLGGSGIHVVFRGVLPPLLAARRRLGYKPD